MTGDWMVARVLLAVALAVALSRVLSVLLRKVRQPPVLAEILAGVALGPTLLGALPGADQVLFPTGVQRGLAGIGTVGLALFMFTIGLELDLRGLRGHGRLLTGVSLGALVLPFGLGVVVAGLTYRVHHIVAGHVVSRVAFTLFVATALAITAFPVLARIIRDRQLDRTAVGQLACASAAIQDASGWVLLAVALAWVSAPATTAPGTLAAESAILASLVALLARGVIPRVPRLPVVLASLATSAGLAELIGLHGAIGAFLLGALIPRPRKPLLPVTLERISSWAVPLLLPVYFLGPGLHVNLRALSSHDLGLLALVLACATTGKLVGAALPARASGSSWREAGVIGVLLNTRGLIELVVLDIGRTAGILDQSLFNVLVATALLTTLMTSPLLDALHAGGRGRLRGPVAERRVAAAVQTPGAATR